MHFHDYSMFRCVVGKTQFVSKTTRVIYIGRFRPKQRFACYAFCLLIIIVIKIIVVFDLTLKLENILTLDKPGHKLNHLSSDSPRPLKNDYYRLQYRHETLTISKLSSYSRQKSCD